MHIHIAGICGTFMGGLALIARQLGHRVTGSDQGVYPPMSTQLSAQGIDLHQGYAAHHLEPKPDLVIIGNSLSRGNALVEAVLDQGIAYTSGPQWLAEHVLTNRWVLAVAGTHGKTTTASLLAWILEHAGLSPGFLIGGVATNFGLSARLGESPFFVIEADEYDTAFFDKRPKFIHYHPRTAILNNLEFDHADIFADLDAIKQQFHYFIRTIPSNGRVIINASDPNLGQVLDRGLWTETENFCAIDQTPVAGIPTGPHWQYQLDKPDGSQFSVLLDGTIQGQTHWPWIGDFNVSNATAAIAAARHAGVPVSHALEALQSFQPVKRRMEICGKVKGITVYDDFAHHPTAIRLSLKALRQAHRDRRIIAVLEPRSNSMRMGAHQHKLAAALSSADQVIVFRSPDLDWDPATIVKQISNTACVYDSIDGIIEHLAKELGSGDQVIIMSNGAFGGIHEKLLERLGR